MLHAIQLLIGRFQTNLESGIAIQYDKGLLAGCQNYTDCLRNIFQVMQTQLEKQREEMRQKSRKPVEDAKYFIEMHYGENISQEDVAEYVGLSSVYLSRSFKAETGIGFSDYLTDVRLNQARKMLTDTNLTINQIAETVGYLDSGYFGKIFKKKYGLKPGEFRTMFSRRK